MKVSVGEQKFRGEMPRAEPCLLPNNFAQAAELTKLISGDIEPWRGPLVISSSGGSGTMPKARNPGTLQFTEASYDSSGSTATLYVERVNGSTGIVSCDYATADGTAVAGTDYTEKTGTVTFADGDTTPKPITIAVNPSEGEEVIFPWGSGDKPLNQDAEYKFRFAKGGPGTGRGSFSGPSGINSYYYSIADVEEALGVALGSGPIYKGWGTNPLGPASSTGSGSEFSNRYPNGPANPTSQSTIYFFYSKVSSPFGVDWRHGTHDPTTRFNDLGKPLDVPYMFVESQGGYYFEFTMVGVQSPNYSFGDAPNPDASIYVNVSSLGTIDGKAVGLFIAADSRIEVTRIPQPPQVEFTVSLSNPGGGAQIGTPSTATVEIIVP